jgi:hypothetical protein
MKRKAKRRGKQLSGPREASPLTMLDLELQRLLRDLRTTGKAYIARLESDLRAAARAFDSYGPADRLSREQLHQIRDLTIELRKRKLKPEKGRRKDLRRIDSLIGDLRSAVDDKA